MTTDEFNNDNRDRHSGRRGDHPTTPQIMRNVFGIFMVLIYVGMGILLFINFFQWNDARFDWVRYVGGTLFVLYGLWRGYRQVKGIDSNL